MKKFSCTDFHINQLFSKHLFYSLSRVDGLEIKKKRMTKKQVMDTVIEHYMSGIISNMYTVVLELDVLGNPMKLITGIQTGITKLVVEPLEVYLRHLLIASTRDPRVN